MPSAAVLEQKKQIVEQLSEKLKNACAGVVVDYKGINVADDTTLRKSLREANVDYFVVKNTLLKLAASNAGLEGLDNVLEGTTALALSNDDYISAARILNGFAEKNEFFNIKSGFMDGKVIEVETVKELAGIPAKEVLIAKALGSFKAPISNLVYALNAIAEKQGA
ncbi:MAG: 50S ribosomal protein L10 [Clostridia bacterium]|nr:50S ribosomal protein L10 [Clostridia bacterium]